MTRRRYRQPALVGPDALVQLPPDLEFEWQGKVYEIATFYGWRTYHTHDSRRSEPGWLDLVLCKPPRLLFVELKAEGKYPTPDQRRWLADLYACGQEVGVWWPHSLDEVRSVLGPRAAPLVLPVRYRPKTNGDSVLTPPRTGI